jgi:hypothetical protein
MLPKCRLSQTRSLYQVFLIFRLVGPPNMHADLLAMQIEIGGIIMRVCCPDPIHQILQRLLGINLGMGGHPIFQRRGLATLLRDPCQGCIVIQTQRLYNYAWFKFSRFTGKAFRGLKRRKCKSALQQNRSGVHPFINHMDGYALSDSPFSMAQAKVRAPGYFGNKEPCTFKMTSALSIMSVEKR